MTQANLTENISEMVSKALKKTEVFEKILKIEFYVGSFVLVSSIMGLTCMYMNFSNSNYMASIRNDIKESEDVMKYNIEMNRKDNSIQYDNLKSDFFILNNKLSELIEHQQKIVIQFRRN
jgi:hypothetical protein